MSLTVCEWLNFPTSLHTRSRAYKLNLSLPYSKSMYHSQVEVEVIHRFLATRFLSHLDPSASLICTEVVGREGSTVMGESCSSVFLPSSSFSLLFPTPSLSCSPLLLLTLPSSSLPPFPSPPGTLSCSSPPFCLSDPSPSLSPPGEPPSVSGSSLGTRLENTQ